MTCKELKTERKHTFRDGGIGNFFYNVTETTVGVMAVQ